MEVVEITPIDGVPTVTLLDKLQEELAEMASKVKTNLIHEGMNFGHLAMVMSEGEYRLLTRNATWTWDDPLEPDRYNSTVKDNEKIGIRCKKEAEHTVKVKDYETYLEVEEVLREKISETVQKQHLAALHKKYIGYGSNPPWDMLQHIQNKVK